MNEVRFFLDTYLSKLSVLDEFKDGKFLNIYEYNEAYSKNGSFIQYENKYYKYGGCDRGDCHVVFQSDDFFECLYYPIRGAIHEKAFKIEMENIVNSIDSRIIGFGIMLNLMKKMDRPEWYC